MTNIAVLGVQWGDEGKGKIVDWLSERADVIVRFQGGHNAGHTLVIDGVTHKLNLLPSGVVREGKLCVIGNGVVLSPEALLAEIERLRQAGISVGPDRLKISDRTALLLPLHAEADKLKENLLGDKKIGTTGRGIGPAYEDKAGRRALRLCDLANPKAMRERAEALVAHHNALRRGYGRPELDLQDVLADLERSAEALIPFAAPVWKLLDDATRQGKRLLFEGAQGFLLDVDHGTYPFVTSSVTHPAQAAAGSGVGARSVHYVLGVCKAYTTRVGGGPFPTEETGPDGERMGARGAEFGTVTGRKRRCGWFDAALVSQSCKTAGVDGIALTKLDVLDGAETLKIGVGYKIEGAFYDYLPACSEAQAAAVPVYETLPGWNVSTAMVRSREALPSEAKRYIAFIEERIGVEAVMISVGAERSAVIGGEGLYAPVVLKCA